MAIGYGSTVWSHASVSETRPRRLPFARKAETRRVACLRKRNLRFIPGADDFADEGLRLPAEREEQGAQEDPPPRRAMSA
jgi:hypothetical protein